MRLIPAALILAAIFWFLFFRNEEPEVVKPAADTSQSSEESNTSEQSEPLLGELMLAEHGKGEPLLDVQMMSQFIQTANQEHRHLDTSHFFNNVAMTELLLGKEGMSHAKLPVDHPILGKNEHGETALVDRWGSPYFIHLIERHHIEVASPGPDQRLGTQDDLQWPPPDPERKFY